LTVDVKTLDTIEMKTELQRVARTAEARDRAETNLHEAIRAAYAAGASLRQIRDASGRRLSHESVRVIINRKGDHGAG
jgi:hypothetical protein